MAKVSEWPGAFKAVESAYKLVMKNPAPMWFFVAVYTVITSVSMILQGVSSTSQKGYESYADAVVLLFIVPLINYSFALIAGKPMTVSEFMQFSAKKLLFVIVTCLMLAFIFAGSLLLLVVPAVWTIAWFAQSVYALVDKDLTPIDALKESKRISRDHKGKVWGIIGASLLVSILAAILSIVPYVGNAAVAFATVLTTLAATILYKWLQASAS